MPNRSTRTTSAPKSASTTVQVMSDTSSTKRAALDHSLPAYGPGASPASWERGGDFSKRPPVAQTLVHVPRALGYHGVGDWSSYGVVESCVRKAEGREARALAQVQSPNSRAFGKSSSCSQNHHRASKGAIQCRLHMHPSNLEQRRLCRPLPWAARPSQASQRCILHGIRTPSCHQRRSAG